MTIRNVTISSVGGVLGILIALNTLGWMPETTSAHSSDVEPLRAQVTENTYELSCAECVQICLAGGGDKDCRDVCRKMGRCK